LTITRDALGRVTTVTNAQGKTIGYVHNADGLMTGKNSGGSVATHAYNAAGNLTSVTDATGVLSFARDAAGRITGITYPDSKSISVTHDAAGNTKTFSYPGGITVTYDYDNRNRVTNAAWGSGSSVSFGYDSAGNLLSETRSNGTRTDSTYDSDNAVTGITHRNGATILAQMDYVRNAMGNTVSETTTLPLPPNADKNEPATYNNAGQISTLGAGTYGYDKDGNLTSISGDRSWTITHDPANQPISVTRNGVTATYTHNALKQRVRSTIGSQQRNFHHDSHGRLLFETNETGLTTAWYIYSGMRLIAMVATSGENHYYHFDKTGNTIAMTNSSGAVSRAYAYLPFGEISSSVGTLSNPFTHVGAYGVMDEGDGFYFMRNRYYDARTGRFIQKDPIGFAGGANLYTYVGNNPV
jgi:RHS repeat-associated protein